MGFALHIQRVDGRQGDLPIASLAESIQLFEAIPWTEEMAQWELVPDEGKEECRPLFQVFDDSGHALHITAYSKELLALAYNFPAPASPFGLNYSDEEGYVGTNQFPRGEFRVLLERFFTSETKVMLALLGRYPMGVREELE